MSEHLLDAAGEISGIQVGTGYESVTIGITAALEAARALDAAGLLASPEHDAEVAAKALRDAADPWQDTLGDTPLFAPGVADWLHERADRIEREAGESDADA